MTIYYFDITDLMKVDVNNEKERCRAWDTTHIITALQGIVNRNRPKLYIRAITLPDDYWWNKLRQPNEWLGDADVVQIDSLNELIEKFRNKFEGVVLYDTSVTSTSNVASTIAGAENLLPIRYAPVEGSVYQEFVANGKLPVVRSLLSDESDSIFAEKITGSLKCDAYIWAKEQYLDKGLCNPSKLAYYIDSYWLKNPFPSSVQNHTLTNHDYFISHRAFFFDLGPWDDETPVDDPEQPLGTDKQTLQAILSSAYEKNNGKMIHAGGFVPWAFKYTNHGDAGGTHDPVPGEWQYAKILSAYNAFMDADALGLGAMANASFFQHYPLKDFYPQNPKLTLEDLKKRGLVNTNGKVAKKKYVTFYIGDYDSAAWLYSRGTQIWDSQERGKMPLGWAFNPNLADRIPHVMDYVRRTKTENDWFIAGDSGAGYLNPGMLQEPREFSDLPSGLDSWAEHCIPYYKQWDLSITGFIIDGYAPGLNEKGLAIYKRFSPDGIVAQKIPYQGSFEGMPFIRMNLDLDGKPEDVANTIASRFTENMPEFFIFRTILKTPSWHLQVKENLEKKFPDAIVVGPYEFFLLLKEVVL